MPHERLLVSSRFTVHLGLALSLLGSFFIVTGATLGCATLFQDMLAQYLAHTMASPLRAVCLLDWTYLGSASFVGGSSVMSLGLAWAYLVDAHIASHAR